MTERLAGKSAPWSRPVATSTVVARRLRLRPHQYPALLGALLLGLSVAMAVLAGVIAPYDPNLQDVRLRLRPPAGFESSLPDHLLGTDHLGRDGLSRLLYGARVSLLVGLTGVLVAGGIGVVLGLLAGYHGGLSEGLIMGWSDVQLALPFVLLAMVMVMLFGASLLMVIVLLAASRWVIFARVTQARVLSVREEEYVWAARAVGGTGYRIMLSHILPNVAASVLVVGFTEIGRMILIEASLSFLGLGIPPTIPSWGGMLGDGRPYLALAPWVATLPGLAIMLTVLSINFVGDWLRQRLDPIVRSR